MTETADALIIGGGVQGASLAFHLAQRGVKATILEKQYVAAGATGRSSGLVRMHYGVEIDALLAWESFRYFLNWREMVGGDCAFTRTGFLQLVAREAEDALRAAVTMQKSIGIPTLLIQADDVRRLAPAFVTDDFDVAAFEPESGYAMPSDTAASLMTAAREMGAHLVQECAVTAIRQAGGRVTGLDTSQGSFDAPVIVNAAGPWAAAVNALVGLDLPIVTWRHDIMFVVRPDGMGSSHPTVIDFPNQMYFRPEGGLTLVGLEDGNPLGEPPDTNADQAKPGFVERAVDRLVRRVPLMERGRLQSAHGGYDGLTPDQHPILGPAGPDGYCLDCGHSGTGFKTAPAIGRCLAEWILDGAPQTVDITPLGPGRFAGGDVIQGYYSNIWT
jgi:sarcosine oxidase, subunit beta